jgi:hypothetical protein
MLGQLGRAASRKSPSRDHPFTRASIEPKPARKRPDK